MLRLASRASTRRFPTTLAASQRTIRTTYPTYNQKDTFDEREKTLEDKAIREHERQLLDDMAAQFTKKSDVALGEVTKAQTEIEASLLDLSKDVQAVKQTLDELHFRIKRLETQNK